MADKISIREYAHRLNVNEKAVRKAIAAGRIVRGYDAEAKKILPDIVTLAPPRREFVDPHKEIQAIK